MKKAVFAVVLVLLSGSVSAQIVMPNPIGGSGGSGGGFAAGGVAAGCTINSIVYVDGSGNLACGGAPAPLYSGGTVTFSNGVAAVSPLVVMDNATPVFTVADGGTITGTAPYLGPLGSAANASFAATGGAGTGMYFRTAILVTFVAGGGVQVAEIDTGAFNLGQTKNLCWYPSAFGNPADACINHEAAATFQLGLDVNGAAIAQVFKAHDGITGSNIAGANLTVAGGRGTGTGTGGNLILQTSPSLASGTTAHTLDTRQMVVAKAFALTDNTAATFAVVTLGNDTYSGGSIEYCVVAGDATTAGTECGRGDFSVLDVTAGAGGEVCTFTKVGTPAQALSGSTLAVTLATTTGTDLCNLRITADTNIATPTTLEMRYQIINPGGRTITPQ